MRIIVGSANPVKLAATADTFRDLLRPASSVPFLLEVTGKDVPSGVSDQPRSLEETVVGAHNRANKVGEAHGFADDTVFVGIESGLMRVNPAPYGSKYDLDVCAAVILFSGFWSLGLSGAWMVPRDIMAAVNRHETNLDAASKFAGYTGKDRVGQEEGLIGVLTQGRINRKAYTRQALDMAAVNAWPQIVRKQR